MLKIKNQKGNETTIRKVRNENDELRYVFGTVKDLIDAYLLLGEYPETVFDKWVLITTGLEEGREFNSKEDIKSFLEID